MTDSRACKPFSQLDQDGASQVLHIPLLPSGGSGTWARQALPDHNPRRHRLRVKGKARGDLTVEGHFSDTCLGFCLRASCPPFTGQTAPGSPGTQHQRWAGILLGSGGQNCRGENPPKLGELPPSQGFPAFSQSLEKRECLCSRDREALQSFPLIHFLASQGISPKTTFCQCIKVEGQQSPRD